MTESKPRELTSEELMLMQAPSAGAGTAPLPIPPGTQIAVEQLNPAAVSAAPAAPTQGPAVEAEAEAGAPPAKTPSGPGRKKEK